MSEHNDQTTHSTSSGINAVYYEAKIYRVKYVEELENTATRRLELLEEVLRWYNNYHRRIDLEPTINKIEKEVIETMAKELADD